MQGLDTKSICHKDNVILNRNKITQEYAITFQILNDNIKVSSIINLHLYQLLYELNKDIIERFEIINLNENEKCIEYIIIYKQMAGGTSSNYMHIKTELSALGEETFEMRSEDVLELEQELELELEQSERIYSQSSKIIFTILNEHAMNVAVSFRIDDNHDEMPLYVKNEIAKIIKLMFLRLKTAIEY
jgi:hypothetical protein